MIDKAAAEAANWTIAQTWADGLGLEYAGVALGDVVVYPLISTLNRIALEELAARGLPTAEPA